MKSKLVILFLLLGGAIAAGAQASSMGAYCMNPSGQWVPLALTAAGAQALTYRPVPVNLYGQYNGNRYPLQCDASGNLITASTAPTSALPIVPQGVDSVQVVSQGTGQTSGIYWAVANYGGAVISYHIAAGGTLDDVRVIRPGGPYSQPPSFTVAAGGTPAILQAVLPVSKYRTRQAGDSLTVGTGGYNTTPIPALVSQQTGLQAINQGGWGNTSSQICVRTGGCQVAMTISGGTIPACAALPCTSGTAVTFTVGSEPVTSTGPYAGVPGTITNGGTSVHGTVSYNGSAYTFTPSDVAGSVSMASGTFQADARYSDAAEIIWSGRNDITQTLGESQFLANVASTVSNRASSDIPYLVLGITGQMLPVEASGGATATIINQWNSDLGAAYGTCSTPYATGCHFLNIDSILKANADQTNAMDKADVANGWIPASMRSQQSGGTLNGAITTTSCPVLTFTTGSVVSAGQILIVLDGSQPEEIYVSTVSGGNTVTACTRNYNNSTIGAQAHSSGVAFMAYDNLHLGAIAQTIIAQNIYQWLSSHWAPALTVATEPQRSNLGSLQAQTITGNNPSIFSGYVVGNSPFGSHASITEQRSANGVGQWLFGGDPALFPGGITIANNTGKITLGLPGSQITISSNSQNLILSSNTTVVPASDGNGNLGNTSLRFWGASFKNGVTIGSSNLAVPVVSSGTQTAAQVACIKAVGPPLQVGTCAGTVNTTTGACGTCN